jgi:chromosome segregation ATPase
MKLSKRIWDAVRANLAPSQRRTDTARSKSPKRIEAQLDQIQRSLTQAAARLKRLEDDLGQAELEGREWDAIRLRREVADLSRSQDDLRAALDLIQARLEMDREGKDQSSLTVSPAAEEANSSQVSLASEEEETRDLAARKQRLAAPEERKGTTGEKP